MPPEHKNNSGKSIAGEPAATARPVILIVDDQPANIKVLHQLLHTDYTTISATGGAEALALANVAGQRPDMILLDIAMPGMDGFKVLHWLKASSATRDIPVLFVTSREDSADETRGLELGASDYLIKPVIPAVLRARVQTHLALKAHRDRLEELAETRARQLVHAERLSTLGALSAGIIHEINSPLTYVIGFADFLLTDMQKLASKMPPLGESESELLAAWRHFLQEDTDSAASIVKGAKRIKVIMESMRKFSRRGQEEKSPVSLAGCIENALTLCHNALKYQVTVHKELPDDLPPVLANSQQVEQVFVNLFKNAADAMGKKRQGTLAIALRRADKVIRCTVEDSGPGIAPDQLGTIWEPFFTTKDAETGTGLGLSVSRGIIEDHQGRIWAENREEGAGARFVVELPVAEQEKQLDQEVTNEPTAKNSGGG